jgi:hypothetical protein
MILVDGNPLDDITILQDHDKINMVMKAGKFYKEHPEDEHAGPDPHDRATKEELFVRRRA